MCAPSPQSSPSGQTGVKFIVAYADSAQVTWGTNYQPSNWIYAGLNQAMPLYSLGGQPPRHSRCSLILTARATWDTSPPMASISVSHVSSQNTDMSVSWIVRGGLGCT